jgi:septal ring factor EnvC (AmiA/AmiB activator)
MTTRQQLGAQLTHDLAQLRSLHELHQLAIAEVLGDVKYLTKKLERIAMDAAEFQAKLDELSTKLSAYEANEAAIEAAKDVAVATLTSQVADLKAQVAAGATPDFTAFAASIQSDIDSIPSSPVVPPTDGSTTTTPPAGQ